MAINNELQNLNGLDNINWLSTTMDPNMMMYWNDYANTMAWINMAINVFMLLSFIWIWYGLYVLAKKMNIKNAWMG